MYRIPKESAACDIPHTFIGIRKEASMATLSPQTRHHAVPTHIAVLADNLCSSVDAPMSPRPDRYRADVERIFSLVPVGLELGVPIITLGLIAPGQPAYSRADQAAWLQSLAELLDATAADLHALGVAVHLLGELPVDNTTAAERLQQINVPTRNTTRLILNLVFSYDSRADIAQAMRRMRADGIGPDQVTEELLSSYLVTRSIPDPDLIIQTGGRLRLGNFLLWQAAYAEYYAAPVGWLDFDHAALRAAIAAYAARERRFGAIFTAPTDCD